MPRTGRLRKMAWILAQTAYPRISVVNPPRAMARQGAEAPSGVGLVFAASADWPGKFFQGRSKVRPKGAVNHNSLTH